MLQAVESVPCFLYLKYKFVYSVIGRMKVKAEQNFVGVYVFTNFSNRRVMGRLRACVIAVMVVREAVFSLVAPQDAVVVHKRDTKKLYVRNRIFYKRLQNTFEHVASGGFTAMVPRGQDRFDLSFSHHEAGYPAALF